MMPENSSTFLRLEGLRKHRNIKQKEERERSQQTDKMS